MTSTIDERVQDFVGQQRWFGGKGRPFTVAAVHRLSWLSPADSWPAVRVELVEVTYDDGDVEVYQIPVAYYRHAQARLAHALIGDVDDPDLGSVLAYDALQDRDSTGLWLQGILDERSDGDLVFVRVPDGEEPTVSPSLVISGEQSNTSLVFGEETLLKVFRKVASGRNPDIEIHEALTRHKCDKVAALLGWVSGSWSGADGTPVTADLAMLQKFLRTATDGWSLALTSVRDLFAEGDLYADEVGGDFAGEAHRLGSTTGEVHLLLAELFPTATWGRGELAELAAAMNARLDAALPVVLELGPLEPHLRVAFDAVARISDPVPVQRVHGDLHLGQTMRTVLGWKLLDFEGEPARPLSERVRLDSPLRDVAGMLRSFVYAAHSLGADQGAHSQIAFRAAEWSKRNREAFTDGYAEGTGNDPRTNGVLLRAYELDKAVYETMYESRNRPTWLHIPLESIQRGLGVIDPEVRT